MNTQLKFALLFTWMFCTFTSINGLASDNMQRESIERIIEKYAKSKYAESVDISPALLKQLSGAKSTDKLLSGVSGFRLVVIGKTGEEASKLSKSLEQETRNALQKEYSRLMSINSEGSQVSIYMEENSKQMVMLINAENDFTVMLIDGTITQELIKAVMDGEIKIK